MSERIQFVDNNDQIIGAGTREEAWANGYYQRLAIILLTDGQGNVLLQKRDHAKKIYPDRWTATASGHVDEGETYEIAAARELEEEMGIVAEVAYLGKFRTEEKLGEKDARMFNAVFTGTIARDTVITIEKKEVNEARWFNVRELQADLSLHPDAYTPSLKNPLIASYLQRREESL